MNRIVLPALVVGTLTAACDQPETVVPVGPSPASANSIEIVGPSTIPPGTPVQYTANVRLSDGRTKTSSPASGITWQSSSPSVLSVNSGLVTPVANQGEAFITASLRVGNLTRQQTREVIILPAGTFRVTGRVTEEGAQTVPVVGARVEVDSGSPFAITNSNGDYRLYGVPPAATLRVTAPSYNTAVLPVQLTNNTTTRSFALTFNGQRPNLAGNYTVRITAPGSCSSLPAEFRNRQYDAVVTQTNAALDVRLTSPSFRRSTAGRGDSFSGTATSNGAVFALTWPDSYYYYYYYLFYSPSGYPNLVESVSNNRYLVTRGTFTTTGGASGLVGNTGAGMTLWDGNFPGFSARLLNSCFGTTQLRLDPR